MDTQVTEFLYFLSYFYLQHNRADKAQILLKAILALTPPTWHVCTALAYALLQQEQFELAEKLARQALDLAKDRDQKKMAMFLQARALWGQGLKAEARQILDGLFTKGDKATKLQ